MSASEDEKLEPGAPDDPELSNRSQVENLCPSIEEVVHGIAIAKPNDINNRVIGVRATRRRAEARQDDARPPLALPEGRMEGWRRCASSSSFLPRPRA
ncbi:hypothetical protein C0J52_01272 [Blattella germanica]|nr:hypothetical protein C0J52_01272 [Blattella germanica]